MAKAQVYQNFPLAARALGLRIFLVVARASVYQNFLLAAMAAVLVSFCVAATALVPLLAIHWFG